MKETSGMTLAEMLIAVGVFGIVMSFTVMFFITTKHYYWFGADQLDVQSGALLAIRHISQELRESTLAGTSPNLSVRINATHDAILFLSARNLAEVFQYSATGQPVWQKWVSYYLTAQPGGAYSELIRQEGDPFSSGFPSVDAAALAAKPPANWESYFPGSMAIHVAALDIQTLDLEDINCAFPIAGNPIYIQVVSSTYYGGVTTSLNPGIPVTFNCAGKSGNWVNVRTAN